MAEEFKLHLPESIALKAREMAAQRHLLEHIIPLAKGGSNDEENLWLACPFCIGHKSNKTEERDPETGAVVALFNPRTQRWQEHFAWINGGLLIAGLTPCGRATVRALHLDDDPDAIQVRSSWILAGWHPPKD